MIRNIGAIKRRHRRFIRAHGAMVNRAMAQMDAEVRGHVRDQATFRHRTGAAKAGVRTRIVRLKSGVRMRITNVAPHAKYLEFGTKPHIITARRGSSLSFYWARMGKRMSVKRVRHPGTKPYRFMLAAAKHAHQSLNPELRAGMRRVAKRF